MQRPTTPETNPTPLEPPGAPRWGPLFDESFAPRKSARVAQRSQRDKDTCAPPERSELKKDSLMASPPSTRKTNRFTDATDLISQPSATKAASRRQTTGTSDLTQSGSRATTNSMLATPAKTPTSKKTAIAAGSINSVARNLFPYSRASTIDEAMPSPKKKGRKKLAGFEINSDAEEEPPIQIYTDSKDRIPEVDKDSPFYDNKGKASNPKLISRTTKRRKVAGAVEAEHEYGSETNGTNGAVFTFRGRKMWRAIEETKDDLSNSADAQLEDELDALVPPHLTMPVNSVPFKGKWLFGENPRAAREEEEATTDIDERAHKKAGGRNIKYPSDGETATTSNIRATGQPTPTTTRVTRAHKLSFGHDGARDAELASRGGARGRGRTRGGNTTAFDNWHRTRSPMEDPSSRGSPTRKSGRRGMTTRSAGDASTAHV